MEYFDVLIVGAGIAGVGSSYHLRTQAPDKSFLVLEGYESFGGTWWSHRYPGIRSDSDLHTFGYRFKPWTGVPIATAEEILNYMGEVIEENDIAPHIRYNHWVEEAHWSSQTKRWTITATNKETGETVTIEAGFLWMCQGYYDHETGYTPHWDGMENFEGTIVHPKTWPEDLDYHDKDVVVIGSGATTATLVPAMAEDCKSCTVLQRSPTYFRTGKNKIDTAERLRKLEIPEEWIHEIVRREMLYMGYIGLERARKDPELVKEEMLDGVREYLSDDVVKEHFTPRYRPWQQRVAFVPDADLFKAISDGAADVVTDEIDCFTTDGIRTKSGKELKADIIVTATGFNMKVLGGIDFFVDNEKVDFAKTVTYRGMMFTGVPNMIWVFGYFRAAWTLRVDLLGDFVIRLLKHMDEKGVSAVTPVLNVEEEQMERFDWIDPENFNPNYLRRAMDIMPKRIDKPEWQHTQNYWLEKDEIPDIDLDDPVFVYQ